MVEDFMSLIVYVLTNKDVQLHWRRQLKVAPSSITQEDILRLWQVLLQLEDGMLVTTLYVFESTQGRQNRVLLFMLENDKLLVCNNVGSDGIQVVELSEIITMLDEWFNLPLLYVKTPSPLFSQLFQVSSTESIKSVHLLTEVHAIEENTNLRWAHFQLLCRQSEFTWPAVTTQSEWVDRVDQEQ